MNRILNTRTKTVFTFIAIVFLFLAAWWLLKANPNPIQLTWVPNHANIDYAKLDSELYELITDVNKEYSFSYHKDLGGNITGINVSTRSTAFKLEPSDVDQLINVINQAASVARATVIVEPKFFPKSKMTLTFDPDKDDDLIKNMENRPKGTYTATLDWRTAEMGIFKVKLLPWPVKKFGNLPMKIPDANLACVVSVPLSNAIPSTSVAIDFTGKKSDEPPSSLHDTVVNYFRENPLHFAHTRSFEDPYLESIPKENFDSSNDRKSLWITVDKFQKDQGLTSEMAIEDHCRQKILRGDYRFADYLQPVKPEKKEISWIQKATRNPNWKN